MVQAPSLSFPVTIGRAIAPYKKHVKRVHTDGFICDEPIDLETGSGLGEWKLKEGACTIENASVVKWE
jgi:hypothetical protein